VVHLPFSKNKRYLTGIDWIVHTFDHMNKRATGAGNMSQIVLELDGAPSKDELRQCLTRFIKKYPVVNGQPARDYNLAPYWKIPPQGQRPPLSFDISRLDDDAGREDVFARLARGVNAPFKSDREHLAFHLVYAGKKGFVAMTFDHRLFDARGAEAFLGLFQREFEGNGESPAGISLTEPAHLCRWREKFKAGQQVNRAFLRLGEKAPPRVLPVQSSPHNRGFSFKIIPFDKAQTAKIVDSAYDEAGYLLLMPYMLGVAVKVLHGIFTARDICSGDYVISVSIDTRPPEKVRQEIFFNHVSFFLFLIRAHEADRFPALLASIKRQMYDQVKSGLPRDIEEASALMRILPLPILSHLMRLHLKGEIASFCFSYVGEAAYTCPSFMKNKVHNIFHMPRVPVPPGLGIFFHQSHGKLSAVLSFAAGMLSDDEVNTIVHGLESWLGV
jgi:hypothetical protein